MKPLSAGVRILLAWAALLAVQTIAGIIVPLKAPSVGNFFAWLMASNLLVVTALGFTAVRSDWQGLKLGLALSAIPFGIAVLNVIEGAVFLTASGINWPRLLAYQFVVYALAGPLWVLIFGRRGGVSPANYHPIQSQTLGERLWKFAVSDFAYLFLYFLAGMIIFPWVKDFYATQSLPSAGKIVALQLLVRGPVFAGICLLLLRMLGLRRLAGALAVGLVFTIVSGVAPLLMPNPYFPDSVRWVHFCEVTSSNFLFGALVGWIWGPPRPAAKLMSQAA